MGGKREAEILCEVKGTGGRHVSKKKHDYDH